MHRTFFLLLCMVKRACLAEKKGLLGFELGGGENPVECGLKRDITGTQEGEFRAPLPFPNLF